MKNTLLIITLLISASLFSQSCDHYFELNNGGTVQSGELGCLIGDLSGSVTVQPGGVLKVCGVIEITGTVTVNANGYSTPGKVLLTEGTSVHVSSGSWTFNDQQQLEYEGDAGCYAEIYKTFGTANVLMFNPPGPLSNSSNIYLHNFYWQWGDTYRGSAQLGRAPSLCGGSFGGCEAILPIELSYFKGDLNSGLANLYWETLSEVNNDYFLIEKSFDGVNWKVVSKVNGAGNSSNSIKYSFQDKAAGKEVIYYKLTQVDYNGNKEEFNIISLNDDHLKVAKHFSVHPNPSNGSFALDFDVEKLELISSSGSVVLTESNVALNQSIDVSDLLSGIYFVKITKNGLVSTTKLIVR